MLFFLSCSTSVQRDSSASKTDHTSIVVTVYFEDSWELTQLKFAFGEYDSLFPEIEESLTSGIQVRILLDDSMAGQTLPLTVWGLASGELVAKTVTSVTPKQHQTVQVDVTLAHLSCGDGCSLGDVECSGDGTHTCQQDEGDGCFIWSNPTPCPIDKPYCSLGQCSDECEDECTSGEVKCIGADVSTCGQYDTDECVEWSAPEACEPPPENECKDSNTLVVYNESGACSENVCSYVSSNTTCDAVCENGACVPLSSMIATGYFHSCALHSSGSVRCWGFNAYGQLGYGNTNNIGDNEIPASVGDVDIGSIVTQIAAGSNHTCALLLGGSVRCWGSNGLGQLGYGNSNAIGDDETPASAGDVDIGDTVTQIAAGSNHTCALLLGGSVRCWGSNGFGQLGYGNTNNIGDNEIPASVGDVDIGSTVTQIAAGDTHTCALLSGGTVHCWGLAHLGQLGYGNINSIGDNETPASAGDVDIGNTVTQIAGAGYHTCALLSDENIRCWGWGGYGQLGYGNTNNIGDNEIPTSVGHVDIGNTVTQIAAGTYHTCALLSDKNIRCWGLNNVGQLGYGNTNNIGDNEIPTSVGYVDIGNTVTQIAAGTYHTCALLSDENIRCWGWGDYGELGYGNTENIGDDETPASAGDIDVW